MFATMVLGSSTLQTPFFYYHVIQPSQLFQNPSKNKSHFGPSQRFRPKVKFVDSNWANQIEIFFSIGKYNVTYSEFKEVMLTTVYASHDTRLLNEIGDCQVE